VHAAQRQLQLALVRLVPLVKKHPDLLLLLLWRQRRWEKRQAAENRQWQTLTHWPLLLQTPAQSHALPDRLHVLTPPLPPPQPPQRQQQQQQLQLQP